MAIIITSTIALMLLSAVAGWYFGTWQTRLRYRKNIGKDWNEAPFYYRYWNPWNKPHHHTFTPKELATPKRRAEKQPEDTRIPR